MVHRPRLEIRTQQAIPPGLWVLYGQELNSMEAAVPCSRAASWQAAADHQSLGSDTSTNKRQPQLDQRPLLFSSGIAWIHLAPARCKHCAETRYETNLAVTATVPRMTGGSRCKMLISAATFRFSASPVRSIANALCLVVLELYSFWPPLLISVTAYQAQTAAAAANPAAPQHGTLRRVGIIAIKPAAIASLS